MFGKAEWFREKKFGWGLVPVTRQGYVYCLAWLGVIVAPFLLLMLRMQVWEGFAWMAASIGLLVFDVRTILQTLKHPRKSTEEELFFIGDDSPNQIATQNYDMQLRDPS